MNASPQNVALVMLRSDELRKMGWDFKVIEEKVYLTKVPVLRGSAFTVEGVFPSFQTLELIRRFH